MIYLDNAATSWPKPDCVSEAMVRFMRDVGASPGRSGHRLALEAERVRLDAREALAELFGLADPLRIIFTHNATTALNLAIRGLLPPGSHAVATGMEHNAVLRTLRALEPAGVTTSLAACEPDGTLDPGRVKDLIQPSTRLIIATHASNVCGTVLPIGALGQLARELGITFLVDAAQTAGGWPIDMSADAVDLLAFTGHKALLGPTGTGGLAISPDFDIGRLPPLVCGGTGSRSEHEVQPDFLPDKYEAGTANMVGLAGLGAAVRYVLNRGVNGIREHEARLTRRLIDGLRGLAGVRVRGTLDSGRQTAAVSFTVAGRSASDIAAALDESFGVLCRPGLHCAPRAHRTLGTLPEGTVRFSPGVFTTEADVALALAAVVAVSS